MLKKFKYAFDGIKFTFFSESTFRILSLFLVINLAMGIIFKIESMEWMIIILFCVMALVLEMLNTVIERVCDVFSQGWLLNEIKIIKDMCAGAVLLMSLSAFTASAIIFIPKL